MIESNQGALIAARRLDKGILELGAQGWVFGISRAATGAIVLAAALSVAQAQTAAPSSSDKSSTAAKSTTPAANASTDKKSIANASAKTLDKSKAKHSAKHDDKKKTKSAKAGDKRKSNDKKSAKAKTEKSKSAAMKKELAAPIKAAVNAVPMPRTRPGATPDLRANRHIASNPPKLRRSSPPCPDHAVTRHGAADL